MLLHFVAYALDIAFGNHITVVDEHDLVFVAGEVKEPQRTLPRALIIGTGWSLCQMFLPRLIPMDPLSMPSLTNSMTSRSVSACGPPAMTTGTGQPATTLSKSGAASTALSRRPTPLPSTAKPSPVTIERMPIEVMN